MDSPDFLGFIYLLLFGSIFYLFQLPEIVKAFFALPSLIILPYLFGRGLLTLINRITTFHEELNGIYRFLYYWFVGFFSLFVIGYVTLLNTRSILLYIIIIFVVSGFGFIRRNSGESLRKKLCFLSHDKRILLLVIVVMLSILPVLIAKCYTDFPLPIHTDWTTISGDYKFMMKTTQYGLIAPFGVDELCSRNILGAVVSVIFNVDPLSLLWAVPFILTPVIAVGTYLLSYSLSKSAIVALIAGIVSTWLLSGSISADFPTKSNAGAIVFVLFIPLMFLTYKTFSDTSQERPANNCIKSYWGSLIVLTIIWVILKQLELTNTDWTAKSGLLIICEIIFCASLVMLLIVRHNSILKTYVNPYLLGGGLALLVMHTFYALFYVFIIALFLSVNWLLTKNIRLKRVILLLSAFAFFFIFLQYVGVFYVPDLNIISSKLFPTLPPYDFFVKFQWLTDSIGVFNVILVSIGALFLALGKNKEYSVLAMLTLIFLFYFLPEAWSYRFLNASLFFMSYAIANISEKVKLRLEK